MQSARLAPSIDKNTYPFRPEDLEPQFAAAEALFPGLSTKGVRAYAHSLHGAEIPDGTEHIYVVPRRTKFAGGTLAATRCVVDLMREKLGCEHWGQNAFARLRSHDRTHHKLAELGEIQGDEDYLLIPAQLGRRWVNQKVDDVHRKVKGDEFCLGIFEVGCMLLMQPSRLMFDSHLAIDCAGDLCFPTNADSTSSPFFAATSDGHLELDARYNDIVGLNHGSATGFIFG